MSDDESKIIIDEGWKAQVERERDEERLKPEPERPATEDIEEDSERTVTLFESLISSLAAQTMMALGLIAPEGQQQVVVDLGYAKQMIDTLVMLKDKTAGNLEKQEESNLSQAIAELQRAYAARAVQVREAMMKQGQPGASGTQPGAPGTPPGIDLGH